VVVELLEKLIADTAAGGGAGGGVECIKLSALATVDDVEATHYWEDVVLHCFPEYE